MKQTIDSELWVVSVKDPQMAMAEDFVSCVSWKIINQRKINGKILLT